MHQTYHIDMSTPGLLESRSAHWLRVRIRGLFDVSSRLSREVGGAQ